MRSSKLVCILVLALGTVLSLSVLAVLHTAQAAPAATIQSMIGLAPDGGTISIAAGTYTESLTVDKTLTLTGVSSATTIIQAVSGQRVITVTSGHNLRLENLTVTGGHPTGAVGGGIYAADGSLLIVNCRIAGNSADYGGGVFQAGAGGRVDVTGSRIELNTTGNHGGGLYVNGSAALTNTLVLSNTAGWHGGGLHVDAGRTDLNGGLFSNNRAMGDNGGAVNVNNSISVTGTQFISNTANDSGGALLQWNAGYAVTVTNARFERNTAKSMGGGAFVSSTLIISNSTFVSNTVDSGNANSTFGGGLYAGGAGQIFSTMFTGNAANCNGCAYPTGGGLYSGGSLTALATVTFNGNQARGSNSGTGGGMYSKSGNLTMTNIIFSGNQVDGWGGGLADYDNNSTLSNVIFSGNKAAWGGGIFNLGGTRTLINSTLSGNSAVGGGGVYNLGSSTSLVNCIVWGNGGDPQILDSSGGTPAITYSDIQGTSVYTGTGNINADPQFVAPITATVAPTTTGNYHLSVGSAAINAGTNVGVATDIDGEPRDAAPDIGADEYRTCWARLNDDTTDYGHVQAAVDASTRPTDTVKVAGYCPGVQSRAGISQTVYVSKSLTLRGGYTLTNWYLSDPVANPTVLDARQAGRVVFLTGGSGVNVTLENLTMRGGSANDNGGGIYDNVTLTLSNAIVRDNVSNYGWGGGVYVQTGNATVSGGQIFSNTANVGGGVYVQSGSAVVVSRAQILSNTANIGGGGVYVNGGALRVTDSTVSGNTGSWWGGGIVNYGSALTLTNSTLSGNQAISSTFGGGAIDQGGGLSSATILNSTIVSNTAVNAVRSGIWLERGTLNIGNSIVALNNGTNNVAISGGTFTSLGYNLTDSGAGTPFTATGDLINTNPLLGPLQNNGGSTWTHALLPGSPAIDQIPFGTNGCGTSITTDQHGQPRPIPTGGRCDIGAYELQFACRAQIGTGATFDSGDAAAVQTAVDAAPSGDTVKVAGTCAGVEQRAGTRQTVYIAKSLTLRGGYTTTNWTTSNPVANPTVLDAQQGGRAVYISNSSPTLSGLRLTGGVSLQFTPNDKGGGIYVFGASPLITGCQIYSNSALSGGGVGIVFASNVRLVGNRIYSNTAASSGGGVYLLLSDSTLVNTIIADNQAPAGSGLRVEASSPKLLQTTLVRNAGQSGVYIANSGTSHSTVAMTNTILVSQTVGITVTAGNTATLNGVLWFSNTTNHGGAGNIAVTNDLTGTPAFAADGYHLTAASMAIDRGMNSGVTADIDGDSRPWGDGYDLGADEFRWFTIYLPLVVRQ